jgi:hypothetical protein
VFNFFELTDVGWEVIESLQTPLIFLLLFFGLSSSITKGFLEKEWKPDLLFMIWFIADDSPGVIGVMLASHADYYSI